MQSNYQVLKNSIKASKIPDERKDDIKKSIINGDIQLITLLNEIEESYFKAFLIRGIFSFCSDEQRNGLLDITYKMKDDSLKGYIFEKVYEELTDEKQWNAIRAISKMGMD